MKKVLVFFIFAVVVLLPSKVYTSEVIDLGIDVDYHMMKADNNNKVHIVWIEKNQIWYGQLVGDEVINRELIDYDANNINKRKFRPRLSVKPDGTQVHIAWVAPERLPDQVIHCYRDFSDSNGEFETRAVLSTVHNFHFPSVVADSDGVIHYFYHRYSTEGEGLPIELRYARKQSLDADIEKVGIIWGENDPSYSLLAVDPKGGVHASWSVNKVQMKYCYTPSGGNIKESSIITLPTVHTKNLHPAIYVDPDDNVHIASLSYEKPGTNVHIDYMSKASGNSNFSTATHASIDLFKLYYKYKTYPTVGAFSKDDVYVCWAEPKGISELEDDIIPYVKLSRRVNGEWVKETLDDDARLYRDAWPNMAITSSYVYVIWRHQGGKLWLYRDTNCEILPPSNAAIERVESNSLFSSSYIDNITWEKNSENNDITIINYRIYKLVLGERELIAEVGPDTFSYGYGPIVDSQNMNYAIVAVRADGTEGCEATPVLNQ
jgi:hypothetical protein